LSIKEGFLNAYAPGIYPRSETLVQATRDLDRGRTRPKAVEEQRERDLREFVAAQESAGLTFLSDGMLAWQDLFRPLVERSEELEARPLTRFLDTNTFYRGILVEGEPRLRDPIPAPDLPFGRWLATLPSPLAFARAAQEAVAPETLAKNVLAPQVEAWAQAGCALIVLSDPFVARQGGASELKESLAVLPDALPYVLQLPFVDAGPLLPDLADAPVDGIGVDFYATSVDAIPDRYSKEIVAGVIDARSSALEDPSEIGLFIEELSAKDPAGISLSVNGDLQFVPEPIAREKIGRLGRAATALAEAA
jgi:5-methyltetrahydropteroyltriglutamate--homocysteine methyltransferase